MHSDSCFRLAKSCSNKNSIFVCWLLNRSEICSIVHSLIDGIGHLSLEIRSLLNASSRLSEVFQSHSGLGKLRLRTLSSNSSTMAMVICIASSILRACESKNTSLSLGMIRLPNLSFQVSGCAVVSLINSSILLVY